MSYLLQSNQCYRCGKELKPDAKFCKFCGVKVREGAPSDSPIKSPREAYEEALATKNSPKANSEGTSKETMEERSVDVKELIQKLDTTSVEDNNTAKEKDTVPLVDKQENASESEVKDAKQPEELKEQPQIEEGVNTPSEEKSVPKEDEERKAVEPEKKEDDVEDSNNKESNDTDKDTSEPAQEIKTRNLIVASHTDIGGRKRNEDAHVALLSLPDDPTTAYFAVFDGHGGAKASAYCARKMHMNITARKCYKTDKVKALRKGFIITDEKYLGKFEKDGCTAIVALLTEDNHLYVANAGDSRAVLGRDGKAIPLSKDHKPQDEEEKKRIEAAGHEVFKESALFKGQRITTYRIDGVTAVSRSIGDSDFKDSYGKPPEEQACTCVPDIREEVVKSGDFIILACDGLWDVFSSEEAVQFVTEKRDLRHPAQEIAVLLVNEALHKGSMDNISVVLVFVP